jgi:hypothetical protein
VTFTSCTFNPTVLLAWEIIKCVRDWLKSNNGFPHIQNDLQIIDPYSCVNQTNHVGPITTDIEDNTKNQTATSAKRGKICNQRQAREIMQPAPSAGKRLSRTSFILKKSITNKNKTKLNF